eukprot:TRINITY_DN63687_c0_g1_i1.p1 TRINITY_DN63687_c0_g1~~TRINITY_DN63687_c0_g1_i1.p1  ORF type:complete len:242 (+),score=40.82 TRINITY_DN63687_c0_g1_i1:43-768(+)
MVSLSRKSRATSLLRQGLRKRLAPFCCCFVLASFCWNAFVLPKAVEHPATRASITIRNIQKSGGFVGAKQNVRAVLPPLHVAAAGISPLRVTMLSTALLTVNVLLSSVMLGLAKFKVGARPPEDAKLARKFGEQDFGNVQANASPEDTSSMRRWERILANNLENVPLCLICAWGSLFVLPSAGAAKSIHMLLVAGFAVARCTFTAAYALSAQPLRTIAWIAGLGCQLALCALGCAGVLGLL